MEMNRRVAGMALVIIALLLSPLCVQAGPYIAGFSWA